MGGPLGALLLCLCLPPAAAAAEMRSAKGRAELSKNITYILNKLVNTEFYDKRLRPNYGGPPVDVGITIYVSSISAVSEVEMDYTLDMYLRQMWNDPRLVFEAEVADLTIDVQYLKSIWVPDTFFPNEKKSFFHIATTHNSFLRITKDGNITTSQRLTVTATCPMELHLFPLDSQECSLEIESYGYSTDDIKGKTSVATGDVSLPQFSLDEFLIEEKTVILTTGTYSRLICRFLFTRAIGFYMIQIYLPSILIVIISWVSFWLSRDATPARVSLGVTTVLTMTTLMTTTNAAMPKVSYIKSIDIYLGTCFLMVFASLLEYAAVGYLNKKLRMRREAKRKARNEASAGSDGGATFGPRPMFSMPNSPDPNSIRLPLLPMHSEGSHYHQLLGGIQSPGIMGGGPSMMGSIGMPECDCDLDKTSTLRYELSSVGISKHWAMSGEGLPGESSRVMDEIHMKLSPPKRPKKNFLVIYPSSIDKYSRIIFPLGFAAFNAMYWVIYMNIQDTKLEHTANTLA